MASRILSHRSLLLSALWLQCALAQQCFYPDGSKVVAESVHQCSSNGGVCCPENWDCLPNGLCSNKAANIIGRYSCTDKSWGSSCPNFCLDNGSMGGDQAVLQCSDGRYCCDADRVSFNCCDNGAERFDLPDGGTGSMTSSGPTSSAKPQSSSSASPTSSSSPSSSSSSDDSESSSPATTKVNDAPSSTTSVVTSTTSSSIISVAGKPISTVIVATVFTTAVATSATSAAPANAASSSTPPSSSSHSNKTASTVGLAIGIPLGLALILVPLLFFLFRRRRRYTLVARERRRAEVADAYAPADKGSRPGTPLTPEFANGAQYYSAKHVRAPSEIDGGTLGLHRHQPEVAELSAEPRPAWMPEDSSEEAAAASGASGAGATGWQPPPRSAPKLVGGRGYSHRTPDRNPEYQPYLSELPT